MHLQLKNLFFCWKRIKLGVSGVHGPCHFKGEEESLISINIKDQDVDANNPRRLPLTQPLLRAQLVFGANRALRTILAKGNDADTRAFVGKDLNNPQKKIQETKLFHFSRM